MMQISLTLRGLFIAVLSLALEWGNLEYLPGELDSFVNVLLLIVGLVAVYIGRVRKGDINWYGRRINE